MPGSPELELIFSSPKLHRGPHDLAAALHAAAEPIIARLYRTGDSEPAGLIEALAAWLAGYRLVISKRWRG